MLLLDLRFYLKTSIFNTVMNNKPLLYTNKYLRDKKTREELVLEHAATSARIEGVKDAKKRAVAVIARANGSSSKRA